MKTIKTKLAGFFLLLLASAALFLTCDVGLGDSVSTKPPTVSITSPSANSDMAGTFTITGAAAADTSLSSVSVSFVETSSGAKRGPFSATIDSTAKGWSIALNSKASGSYEIPDGTYKVSVVATDSANRTSEANTVYQIDNTAPTVLATSPLTFGSTYGQPMFYRTIDIKGEVYDASTLKSVVVNLLDSSGVVRATKPADGTNTWSVRFDAPAGLTDGSTYYYSIVAVDAAGNKNAYFFHRADIYPLLNVNADGYVTFPAMYDIGQLDQLKASANCVSAGLTLAKLDDVRHGSASTASQQYPDFMYKDTSSATVKFLNLSGDSPAIGSGVPIVGTILPPSDGSSVVPTSLVVDIKKDGTSIHYPGSTVTGSFVGNSVNFEVTLLDLDLSALKTGNYSVQIKYKTNASSYEFSSPSQAFLVSASAPKLMDASGTKSMSTFAQSTVNAPATITGYAFLSDGATPLVATADNKLLTYSLDADLDSQDKTDVAISTDANGKFSITVDAASDHSNDGTNTYTITAKAGSGTNALTTTISRMFVVDTRVPAITMQTPAYDPDKPTDVTWIDSSGGSIALGGNATDTYSSGSTLMNGSGVSRVYWLVSDTSADHGNATDFSGWNKATGTINWSDSYTAAGVGKYLLWVCAVDAAGNIGRVTVPFGLDHDAPVFSNLSSTSDYYTPTTLGAFAVAGISGKVTDDSPGATLKVAVNGGTASSLTLDGSGNWSWIPPTTADGSYTVVFTATDISGKTATITKKYTIDTVAPSLSVTNLDASGTTMFSSTTGLITGKMSDANGIAKLEYTMDGGPWTDTGTLASDWTQSVAGLSEGSDKTIKFRATDSAGNPTSSDSYTISLDCTPPNASFGTTVFDGTHLPISDVETTNGFFTFTDGAMDDATTTIGRNAKTAVLSYTRDGQTAGSVTLNPASSLKWTWTTKNDVLSPTVNLTDGNHDGLYVFTLTVTDFANKTVTAQKIIRIDTKAPTLIVSVPTANDLNMTGSYTIQGSALDLGSGTASVTYVLTDDINTVLLSGNADLNGTLWSKILNLAASGEGTKKLTVTATDNLGNHTTLGPIVFYYDVAAPDLEETSIGPDTQYTNKEISFAGTWAETNCLSTIAISYKKDSTSSVSLVTLPVGDKTIGNGTKAWSYTTSGLADKAHDGSYVFTITATDVANRTTTMTRTVKIDTTKPAMTLATDLSGWQRATDITISGTASDSLGVLSSGVAKVQYSLDNEASWNDLTGTNNWTGTISVSTTTGKTLELRSVDKAGNVSDASVATVKVDTLPPAFIETTPNAVTQTNVNQTFSGTVTDDLVLAATPVTLTRTKNGMPVTSGNTVTVNGSDWSYTQTANANHSDDGVWVLTFTALDSSGLTTVITKSFTVDTTAPAVAITSPAGGQTGLSALSGVSYSFIGTANDTYVGTSKIYYLIDKNSVASSSASDYTVLPAGNGTWNFSKNLGTGSASTASTIGEGSWYLHAYADDALGNTGITGAATVQFDVDQSAPTLKEATVNTVDNQFAAEGATVTYSGTASDTNGFSSLNVMITEVLNGSPQPESELSVPVSGGAWSFAYTTPSGDSSATLVFTATDVVGKTSTVIRKIVVDKTAPTVAITTDLSGWQRSTTIAVSGTAADTGGTVNSDVKKVQYSINNGVTWVDLTGTTIWSGAIDISSISPTSGTLLLVRSVDNAGNYSLDATATLKEDAAAPAFVETTVNSVVVTKDAQLFSGTVSDNLALASTPVTLTRKLNGVPVTSGNTVTITGSSAPYSWSFTQPVDTTSAHADDGVWELTFVATDVSGLTKTITKTYTVDTTAPTLVVESPAMNDCVSASICSISGKAYDTGYGFAGLATTSGSVPADVQYSLDNSNWIDIGSLSGTALWSKSSVGFGSAEGSKTLWVRATDAVGNQTSTKVDFYYDLAPPTLNETTLNTTDTKYYNGNFAFGGTWSETNSLVSIGVSYTKNGSAAVTTLVALSVNDATTGTATKTWAYPIDLAANFMTEGTYVFTLTAKDAANRTSSVTRTVMYDKTAPSAVTLSTDVSGWHKTSSLPISGTAADSGSVVSGISTVQYSLDGGTHWSDLTISGTVSGTASWNGTLSLPDGSANSLTLRSLDKAGNSCTPSEPVTIQVDTIAPDFDITSPVTTPIVNGKNNQSFTITATDSTSGPASITASLSATSWSTITAATTTAFTSGSATITIPAASLPSGEGNMKIYFKVKDVAGNETVAVGSAITVDKTPPTGEVTSHAANATVNKTITVSGTASDPNLSSLHGTFWVWKPTTPDSTDASTDGSWEGTPSDVTVSGTTSWTVSNFNTASYTAENYDASTDTGFQLRVGYLASDTAGNTTYITRVLNVDQDSDRPVLQFSNLPLSDAGGSMSTSHFMWLTGTKTLYGSVVDDDGTSGLTMEIRYKYNSAANFTSGTITCSNGSWSYTLPSGDGPYQLEFTVTDAKGTAFTSVAGISGTVLLSTMKLTDGTNTLGDKGSSSFDTNLYIKEDTAAPDIGIGGISTDAGTSWTESNYSALKLGGAKHSINGSVSSSSKTFQLKGTASDANGIKVIKLVTSGLSGVTGQNLTTTPDTNGNYTFTGIDCSQGTGTMTITVTATDNADNTKSSTLSLSVDNTAPAITVLNPSSTTTSSGKVTAYGTVDESPKEVDYAVSVSGTLSPDDTTSLSKWTNDSGSTTDLIGSSTGKSLYKSINDASFSWYVYFDGDTDSSLTTEHSDILNTYLVNLGVTTQALLDANSFKSVVKLYVWIKVVDSAGNVTETPHLILLDPQGGRPKVTLNYPETNGVSLGGTVRLNGSATDDGSVSAVFVQLVSTAHTLVGYVPRSGATYGSVTADVGMGMYTTSVPTAGDLDYMASIGTVYQISTYKATDSTHVKWTAGDTLTDGSDWGLLASFSGSGWSLNINKNGELNPPGGSTNNVGIRVYAIDSDPTPTKSVPLDRIVAFDADLPVISNLYLVQSGSSGYSAEKTASREYTDDMWVKGDWYLTGTANDSDQIKTLTIGGSELVVDCVAKSSSNWDAVVSGDKKTVNFKYKLATGSDVGNLSFTMNAEDGANHFSPTKTVSVNYDNTAPVLATSGTSYKIDPKIRQSNNFYTLSSQVTESSVASKNQSGFARTSFYFLRRDLTAAASTNYTYTVFDPMISKGSAGNAIDIKNAIDVSAVVPGTTPDGTIVYKSGLYWKYKTMTRDSTNLSSLTLTSSDYNIHKGGLVEIGNALYAVDSVSGTSVTIKGSPESTFVAAYFALSLVVDNTITESSSGSLQSTSGYGYGYNTPLNDDGDRMIEGVSKSGTTWTWEANICSKNIPDGPIEIHYVVFDEAGNYTIGTSGNVAKATYGGGTAGYLTKEVADANNGNYVYGQYTYGVDTPAFVSNNAPRIAGVQVGTDLNNNGIIDSGEWNTSYASSSISASFVTGGIYDVTKLGTTIELGSTTTPLLTAKGYTTIKPEIVGGNSDIYYSYSYQGGTTATVNGSNTKTSLGSGSMDYSLDTLSTINLQLGDLLKAGTTDDTLGASTNVPFAFTIWDSTAGTKTCVNSQHADITLHMGVQLKDGTDPTADITPFHWSSASDNSLYGNSKDNGHIELESDWIHASGYLSTATAGTQDGDPKVSGQIVISGSVFDNRQLSAIYISVPGMEGAGTNGLASAVTSSDPDIPATKTVNSVVYYLVATCSGGTWTEIDALTARGFKFKIVTNTYDATGQTALWTFSWDTAKISGVAATDVKVRILALDQGVPSCGTTTTSSHLSIDGSTYYTDPTYDSKRDSGFTSTQTTSAAPTALYKMDVVPYINAVARNGTYNTYRARSGAVPLLRGETSNSLKGFNLINTTDSTLPSNSSLMITPTKDGSGTTSYAMNSLAVSGSDLTFTVPTTAKSGYLHLVINNVAALNNTNAYIDSNTEATSKLYDRTTLTDDRYIQIWRVSQQDTFAGSKNCVYPAMSSYNNTLYASFSNYSTARVYYSNTLIGTGTVAVGTNATPVFYGYDPPEETDISVNGEVNVFYAANYHGGYTYNWGDGSSAYYPYNDTAPGNAGGIYVSDDHAQTTDIGRDPDYKFYRYELYTYDNELQQFRNIRVIRDNSKIYVAYYDRLTNAIKFSVTSDDGTDTTSRGLSWIVIDGSTDVTDTSRLVPDHQTGANNTFSFASSWNPFVLTSSRFENSLSPTTGTGESVALTTNGNGYPVLVYMDAASGNLRLARASSTTPTTASNWAVQSVLSSTDANYGLASDYIAAKIDTSGYLHIAFQNTKGELVYIKSSNHPSDGTAYSFSNASQKLDDSGTYVDIALNGTTPYISYLSRVNSYDGMKIAYYDSAKDFNNDGTAEGGWETMTAPLNVKVTNVRSCIEAQAKAFDGNTYEAAIGFDPGSDYRAAFFVGN